MGSMFSLNFDASVNSSYQSEIALGFSRWDEIVSGIKSPGGDIPHQITVNISSDSGITAAAVALTTGLENVNGLFYPKTVQLKIKEQNLPRLLSTKIPSNPSSDPKKTLLYYLSLHEACHLLGVGNLWSSRNLLKVFLGDTFYIGSNAVREYKTAFSNWPDSSNFFGVPVEDGGGLGTEGTHPEEGRKSDPGNLPHYLLNNSIIYPGLEGEIMTGWLENKAMPLSRISIAFLEDLNYSVDYSKADNFFVAHDPPATPTPRTPTPLPPETPTKTSTPNAGVTAITPTPRLPPSNFTPYNSIVSKYLEKSNVLKSSNHLNRSNSLKENL